MLISDANAASSMCSYTQCISKEWEVLDHLPALFLEELRSYSSSLSSFFHLNHAYTPVTMATTLRHTYT